jgi:hypothetical protein
MLSSSPGSAPAAPVPHGRAPRRVSDPAPRGRRMWRTAVVGAVAMLAGLALAPAALAHEASDPTIAAVIDKITPAPEGLDITIETTRLGSQFVLENTSPTEVTILSSVGDPLFRIGPEGVLGNFRSPEWYTAKVPSGAITIPERAAERGAPVWARVNQEPAWGWFDHRIHSAVLPDEQRPVTPPLANLGTWSVPFQYGDQLGSIEGHYEYRPPLGSFVPSLSEETPARDLTLTALAGNPTPGVSVDYKGQGEVVVLGAEEEPYLRITPNGTEANALSPTWVASQDPSAVAGRGLDPTASPEWVPVNAGSTYSFSIDRGDPVQDLAGLYAIDEPTTVSEWKIALIVDGERIDVDGETRFTPGGYEGWGAWWIAGAIALGVVALGALAWFARRWWRSRPAPEPSRPVGKKQKVGVDG